MHMVRPLPNVLRSEIMAWLEAQQFEWRRGESNDDTNRIRRVIMPQLQAINPQLAHTLREVTFEHVERLAQGPAPGGPHLLTSAPSAFYQHLAKPPPLWNRYARKCKTTDPLAHL